MNVTNNTFNRDAAEQMAIRLRDYWSAKGYDIEAKVEPEKIKGKHSHMIYSIRTNLVGGKPR